MPFYFVNPTVGAFIIEPEINYVNNAPGVGTWYTILETTTTPFKRLIELRFYGNPAATQTEIEVTVDNWSQTYVNTFLAWRYPDSRFGGVNANPIGRAFFVDGQNIRIRIRGLAGILNLFATILWAQRVMV